VKNINFVPRAQETKEKKRENIEIYFVPRAQEPKRREKKECEKY